MWLLFALASFFFWGLWGFFSKIASESLGYFAAFLLANVFASLLILGVFIFYQEKLRSWEIKDILPAFLAGIAGILGSFFYYAALKEAKASIVVTLTSAYPLVTIFLAYLFLKEALTFKQMVGAALVLAGIALLSV